MKQLIHCQHLVISFFKKISQGVSSVISFSILRHLCGFHIVNKDDSASFLKFDKRHRKMSALSFQYSEMFLIMLYIEANSRESALSLLKKDIIRCQICYCIHSTLRCLRGCHVINKVESVSVVNSRKSALSFSKKKKRYHKRRVSSVSHSVI